MKFLLSLCVPPFFSFPFLKSFPAAPRSPRHRQSGNRARSFPACMMISSIISRNGLASAELRIVKTSFAILGEIRRGLCDAEFGEGTSGDSDTGKAEANRICHADFPSIGRRVVVIIVRGAQQGQVGIRGHLELSFLGKSDTLVSKQYRIRCGNGWLLEGI